MSAHNRGSGAPSTFTALVPLLMCSDVPAQIRFYTEVLGFTVASRMDDAGASGFASLLREFEVVDPEGHVLLFGQDIA